MSLLFGLVAIFASAGLGRIALRVVPTFLVILLYLGFEEVKSFIHVS